MQPDCHHLHPSAPPILFSRPPAPTCCLPCDLSRISNSSLILTLRRAAASNLLMLANTPQQLLHRAAHLAPDLILHLINTYFTLHSTQDHQLSADIRNSLSALITTFDAALIPSPPAYPYLNLVFSRAVEASLHEDADQCVLAARLLCSITQKVRSIKELRPSSVLNAVREGLLTQPNDFLTALLRLLPSAETLFSDITEVVSLALAVIEPKNIHPVTILNLVERAIPPHRVSEADALFIKIADELVNRTVEVCPGVPQPAWETRQIAQAALQSSIFQDVVKNSVISKDFTLRSVVTRIICELCAACPEVPSRLITVGVFDYVIESIRVLTRADDELSANVKRLLLLSITSVHAIVEQEPDNLADKWCYSLDVIMFVTRYLSDEENAQKVSRVLKHAFRHAPVPVFSKELICQFMNFQMTLVTLINQEPRAETDDMEMLQPSDEATRYIPLCQDGMESISDLLLRFRPCIPSMHSILQVCEALLSQRVCFFPIARVLQHLFTRFKSLLKLPDCERNIDECELQEFGRRLFFVLFDSCSNTLGEVLKHPDRTFQTGFSSEEQLGLLELFTSGLDHILVTFGCCTAEDQQRVRAWCWKYFPPRSVFSFEAKPENFTATSRAEEYPQQASIVQRYLYAITVEYSVCIDESATVLPTSPRAFLEQVETETETDSLAWKHLQQSVKLNAIDSICSPDELTGALSRRLQNSCTTDESMAHCLDIMRIISFTCTRYGLNFLSFGIPTNVICTSVQHDNFSMSNTQDANLFRHVLLSESCSEPHVHLWDKLTEHHQRLDHSQADEEICSWTSSCDTYQVVKSAIYALERTHSPLQLATCLLSLFTKEKSALEFVTCCHRCGLVDVLCNILRKLKMSGKHTDAQDEHEFNAERERAASFLLILLADASFASSLRDWTLLRETCETFMHETKVSPMRPAVWFLLSLIARWLLATLYFQKDQSIATFVYQCGVLKSTINLLQVSSGQSCQKDKFVSVAACFLLLFMRNAAEVGKRIKQDLSDLLINHEAWELHLYSQSLTAVQDNAYKVTNTLHLLLYLLGEDDMLKSALSFIRLQRATTALALAAHSSDKILATAALKVLRKIMSMAVPACLANYSSCHLQLSHYLLEKVCSTSTAITNEHELQYLASAVTCGHLDAKLHLLVKTIQLWLQRTKEQKVSGKGENQYPAGYPPGTLCLAKAIDDRMDQSNNKHLPAVRLQVAVEQAKPQRGDSNEEPHVDSPKIVFAQHSVLWDC